jgi:hypothetical protein
MSEPSGVNDFGVLVNYITEIVANFGSSTAEVNIAMGDDQRYRFGISLSYSYGGFGYAPASDAERYATYAQAMDAGLRALLDGWHTPFASDPASVHEELRQLREQVAARLQQPSLF